METTIDEVVIEINSKADTTNNGLEGLKQTINDLTSNLELGIKQLGNYNTAISELSNTLNSVKQLDFSGIKDISEKLQPISNIGKASNLKNMLEQLKQIPEITKTLDTETINQFTSRIKQLSEALSPLAQDLLTVGNAFNALPNAIKNVSSSVDKLHSKTNKIKKTTSAFDLLSKSIKFTGIIAGITAIGNAIGNFVNKSNDYIENLNLFYVSMGKNADKAKEFTDNFSEALGIDPSNVMRYIGMFNTLAEGFGISSDNAYIMSKNLTQLSYDMSSFLNIPIDQAMQKIKSGFAGEIEPMRAVGIALDQATLQETAHALGIKKKVSEMTRAQKTELLYYQIMTRTTKMQGDMARTLIQPANALRVMKQQFTLLARAIGNIFIPIIMKVLPYVMVLTKWLTNLAQAIANFLGFEIDTSSWENLGDISAGIEDIGDSASGTTKELKKMLAPFDELNVIDFGSDSGGGAGTGSSGGSLGIPLPEYDALEGLLNQNLAEAESKLKGIGTALGIIAGILVGFKILDWINKLTALGNTLGWSTGVMKGLGTAASIVKGAIVLLVGTLVGFSLGSFITWIANGDEELRRFLMTLGYVSAGAITLVGALTGNLPLALAGIGGIVGLLIADFQSSSYEIDIFRGALDETKEALTPTYEALESTQLILNKMKWSGLSPSEQELQTLKDNFTTVVNEYKKVIRQQWNMAKSAIQARTDLNEEEKNKQLKIIDDYYIGLLEETVKDEDKITEIIKTAKNEQREITETELQLISDIISKYGGRNTELIATNEKEATAIWENWQNKKVELSEDAAQELIKQSIETRNKTVQEAETQYQEELKIWENMRENGTEEAKKLAEEQIKAAEERKNGVLLAADKQHLELIKKMTAENKDVVNKFNLTTGEFKNLWDYLNEAYIGSADDTYKRLKESGTNLEKYFSETKLTTDSYISLMEEHIKDLTKTTKENNDILNKIDTSKAEHSIENIASSMDNASNKTSKFTNIMKRLKSAINNLPGVKATISGAQLAISKFADGGFPEMGQMFIARESGPELVGNIGNKATVANNDQIVSGIKQGVKEAMLESNSTNQNNGPTNVYIGNRKVYSGYGSYANSENNMYGTNVIKV